MTTPASRVTAEKTASRVSEIVREIKTLLDNCHVVEDIDIAAQHEAVMVLVRSLSDSVSDGSKGVIEAARWLDEYLSELRKTPTRYADDIEGLERVAAALSLALDSGTGGQQPVVDSPTVIIGYTNWRDEYGEREIVPMQPWFGSTDWHPEPQWLLKAWDVAKDAERDFAIKDIGFSSPTEPKAGVVSDSRPRDEFTCGMAVAAGIVMQGWGDDVLAGEILNNAGLTTVAEMRKAGVENYDIRLCVPVLRHFRDQARARAHRAALNGDKP